MGAAPVKYGSWLFRVITWDGLLPACTLAAPSGVQLLIPDRRGAIELTAVALPIVAFFIRFFVGKHHIDTNHCCKLVRVIQLSVFCLGLFPLVVIDAFLILSHVVPDGALVAMHEDPLLRVLFSIDLVAMTIAMYPGREESFVDCRT